MSGADVLHSAAEPMWVEARAVRRVGLALVVVVIGVAVGCDITGNEAAGPENRLAPPRLVRAWIPGAVDGLARVDALASDGKRVFVGGDFDFLGPPGGKLALFSAPAGDVVPTSAAVAGPGAVHAIVSDGAGGWFLGGRFTSVAGVRCPRLAHVRANQRLDRRFCLRPNEGVRALARRGSVLYIGGVFTRIGRFKRSRLAAVDTRTGRLRTWNPGATGETVMDFSAVLLPSVDTIVTSPSRIYVGGAFQRVGGTARKNIAALNPRTGSALNWQVDIHGELGDYVFASVRTLALRKSVLYVGGDFGAIAGHRRPGLAALDATTGGLTPWAPSLSGPVAAVVPTASAVYATPSYSSSADPSGIVVLNPRTGRRIAWIPSQTDSVPSFYALALAGSTLFVGGEFNRIGGVPRSNVAAINRRTNRVTDWQPAFDGRVVALAVSDGKLAVGGDFDTAGVAAHQDLVALDPKSGRPVPLSMNVEGEFAGVEALAVADSTLFVAGFFTGIEGIAREDLAALDVDEGRVTGWKPDIDRYSGGSGLLAEHEGVVYLAPPRDQYEPPLQAVDTQSAEVLPWRPEPEDYGDAVEAIAAGGSRVYLAGDFRSIGGVNRRTLAALDPENGEVLAWDPRPNGEEGAFALAIYDGTLYVGGDFTEIAGAPRFGAAAFDAETGELLNWAPRVAGGAPYAFAADESAVFLGGDFKSMGGRPRHGLAAVDSVTGRPLPWQVDFSLGEYETVSHLVVAGSTLYFAGDFERVSGVPQKGLAALSLR